MLAHAVSNGNRGHVLNLRGVDPETCMIVFKNHWVQVLRVLENHDPTHGHHGGPRLSLGPGDETSTVQNYVEHMLFLLMEEEAGVAGAMGPILEFVVVENVMEKLLLWSLRREFTDDIKLQQLRVYQMLVGRARQPLLRHKPVLRPLMMLLAACSGPSCTTGPTTAMGPTCTQARSSAVEVELVQLLWQLCDVLVKDPSVLELLFHSRQDQGAADFLVFSLLVPFVHRGGPVGAQARDALTLIMALSTCSADVARYIVQNTHFCPVLATGLSGLYSWLPAKLEMHGEGWNSLQQADGIQVPALAHFLNSLQFCSTVCKVAHPSIRNKMLGYIYNGFLVPVMAPALHKMTLEEVMTSTAYLELFLRSIVDPALLQIFLIFILKHRHDNVNILDTLVSRINTPFQLGTVSLALFRTLIGLYCEDVMLQLILRYLIPCPHLLCGERRRLSERDCHSSSAAALLSLTPSFLSPKPCSSPTLPPKPDYVLWSKVTDVLLKGNMGFEDLFSGGDNVPCSVYLEPLLSWSYLQYLSDARSLISTSIQACQVWSAPYDGVNPAPMEYQREEEEYEEQEGRGINRGRQEGESLSLSVHLDQPPAPLFQCSTSEQKLEQRDTLSELERRDTLPELEWRDTLPELERRDTLPELERRDTLPELERRDTLPELERRDTLPELERRDTLPELERRDTLPELERRDTPPELERRDTLPELEWRDTLPELERRDTLPELEWRDTFDHELKRRDTLPELDQRDTVPEVEWRDALPALEWDDSYDSSPHNQLVSETSHILKQLVPDEPPRRVQQIQKSDIMLIQGSYIEDSTLQNESLVYNITVQKDTLDNYRASFKNNKRNQKHNHSHSYSPPKPNSKEQLHTCSSTQNHIHNNVKNHNQTNLMNHTSKVLDNSKPSIECSIKLGLNEINRESVKYLNVLNGYITEEDRLQLDNKTAHFNHNQKEATVMRKEQQPGLSTKSSVQYTGDDFISQCPQLTHTLGRDGESAVGNEVHFQRLTALLYGEEEEMDFSSLYDEDNVDDEGRNEQPEWNDRRKSSVPFTGPFISVLLSRLENMLENPLEVNLLVTGILAQLASYPQPLLRCFLLNTRATFHPGVRSLYQVLVSVGCQIERYAASRPEFIQLVQDVAQNLLLRDQALKHREEDFLQDYGCVRNVRIPACLPTVLLTCPKIPSQSRNKVLATFLYAEFLKELAAIVQEHSVFPDLPTKE